MGAVYYFKRLGHSWPALTCRLNGLFFQCSRHTQWASGGTERRLRSLFQKAPAVVGPDCALSPRQANVATQLDSMPRKLVKCALCLVTSDTEESEAFLRRLKCHTPIMCKRL